MASHENDTPLARFLAYGFATDPEYQEGLAGIISSGTLEGRTEQEKAEILLRSEVFYFNRVAGPSITLDEAREARSSQVVTGDSHEPAATSTAVEGAKEEPQTLTFAQLKALIEQGRTDEIPNNKVIPDTLSSESPSESRAEVRRKPWEIDATA
ncbi:hypothetical protein C8Q76DRAFT_606262 [Earliella scabrosa]|nr:hypothetical protein C8Q76DRAFT_606262 [Earliella scabrosa]